MVDPLEGSSEVITVMMLSVLRDDFERWLSERGLVLRVLPFPTLNEEATYIVVPERGLM